MGGAPGRSRSTERLHLRPPRAEDLDAFAAINADPEVAGPVSATGPLTRAETEALLGRMTAHWDEYGYGLWMADLQATGELIGFVGLSHPTFLPAVAHEVEVGWRLARAYWGRGLASEGATAALALGFGQLALERIIAIIDPANARSLGVARRHGMVLEREVDHPRWPVPVGIHVCTRSTWAARGSARALRVG